MTIRPCHMDIGHHNPRSSSIMWGQTGSAGARQGKLRWSTQYVQKAAHDCPFPTRPLAARPTPPMSMQLDGRALRGSRREGPADTPRQGLCLPRTCGEEHAGQSGSGCPRFLGIEFGFRRLQRARNRYQEHSGIFTTSQCGRDRRWPTSVLLGPKGKLRDGRGVCHSEG